MTGARPLSTATSTLFSALPNLNKSIAPAIQNAAEIVSDKMRYYKEKPSTTLTPKTEKIIYDCHKISAARWMLPNDPERSEKDLDPTVKQILEYHEKELKLSLQTYEQNTLFDIRITEAAHDIGLFCLRLLNEGKPNGVSDILKDLSKEDRKLLLEAWAKSQETRFKLLYLYYTPINKVGPLVYHWGDLPHPWITFLKQQLIKPSDGLPKYLLPALKIKLATFEEKGKECLPLLQDKNHPVWHVNLQGLNLETIAFPSCYLPGANFSYSNIRNFDCKGADISHSTFFCTRMSSSNFTNAMTTGCNFKGMYVTPYGTEDYGSKLTGISDSAIREYVENETSASNFKPIRDYFHHYKRFGLYHTFAPRSEYLFAIYLLNPNIQIYDHEPRAPTFLLEDMQMNTLSKPPGYLYKTSDSLNISKEFIAAFAETNLYLQQLQEKEEKQENPQPKVEFKLKSR